MKITRLQQSGFMVQTADLNIYFDPYKITDEQAMNKADYIFISHPHFDHYDRRSIARIIKDDTKIYAPASTKKIKKRFDVIGLRPGDKIEHPEMKMEAVPAYNNRNIFHLKRKQWLGYLMGINDKKIYHAGDTDLIAEMEDLASENIDIAMLPCGGFFTMNDRAVIKAVGMIHPRKFIPMHERKADIDGMRKKIKSIAPDVEMIKLAEGQSLTLHP